MSTPHIQLRRTTMADLPNIMSWVNDKEVTAYFAWGKQVTIEEEKRYLEKLLTSKNDRVYSIILGNQYIGQCSINTIYWQAGNGRIFIALKKDAQGNGYAKRAIATLLKTGFENLKLHKLWLIVREDNFRGLHIYQNCGFRLEGLLREEYFVQDKYLNMVRMAITEEEYRQFYRRPKI